MVDPERLHRLLRRVTADLHALRGYAAMEPADVMADAARLGHVKYLFVTALEGCIDAAHHVAASEGLRPVDTNADAMRALGEHGVLSPDLAGSMASAVRFRNVLVHGYADVDDSRVVGYLQRVGDLEGFVADMARLLGD